MLASAEMPARVDRPASNAANTGAGYTRLSSATDVEFRRLIIDRVFSIAAAISPHIEARCDGSAHCRDWPHGQQRKVSARLASSRAHAIISTPRCLRSRHTATTPQRCIALLLLTAGDCPASPERATLRDSAARRAALECSISREPPDFNFILSPLAPRGRRRRSGALADERHRGASGGLRFGVDAQFSGSAERHTAKTTPAFAERALSHDARMP